MMRIFETLENYSFMFECFVLSIRVKMKSSIEGVKFVITTLLIFKKQISDFATFDGNIPSTFPVLVYRLTRITQHVSIFDSNEDII